MWIGGLIALFGIGSALFGYGHGHVDGWADGVRHGRQKEFNKLMAAREWAKSNKGERR